MLHNQIDDQNFDAKRAQRAFSRRAVLSAIAGLTATGGVFADEPGLASETAETIAIPVRRLVQPIATRMIQLRPVSADFKDTVIRAIATDMSGEIVAVAGDDHAIRIMTISSLDVVQTLTGHSDLIQTLDFDQTGRRLVSAGNDGQLIIWERTDRFRQVQRMSGTPALASVAFSPDGREIAAVGFNSEVYLLGASRRSNRPRLQCECTDLRAVVYRSDSKLLAVAGRNGVLHLFEPSTSRQVGEFPLHSGRIHELQFIEDTPVIATASEDGEVALFDTEKKTLVKRVRVTTGKLFSICVLDGNHLAVAGSDNVIRVVNISLGRVSQQLSGHTGSIASLASSGSLLFSGGYDATLRRWQLSGIDGDRERIAERENPIDR